MISSIRYMPVLRSSRVLQFGNLKKRVISGQASGSYSSNKSSIHGPVRVSRFGGGISNKSISRSKSIKSSDPFELRNRKPGDFYPITWRTVLATFAIASAGVWYLQSEKKKVQEVVDKIEAERQHNTYGDALIGGPFNLIDCENEKQVTEEDFNGKFMILYFGFTHCPDVCPDELEKMSRVIKKIDTLEDVGADVEPIFITVDPHRDNPKVVREYIKEFHPRFRGLTGTEDEISKIAKKYRIYISKGDVSPNDEEDYLVDHSIFFFLMDPNNKFLDFFGRNLDADEIAKKIIDHVRRWKKDKDSGRI